MSSGRYSALTGAISRMKMLDTISDNLSNASTAGFKRGQAVFESELSQAMADHRAGGVNFNHVKSGFTDFKQGTLQVSGSSLHLGIEGEGFFKLQAPDESVVYTRLGDFQLNLDGFLGTEDGYRVLGEDGKPIELTRPDVEIDAAGRILGGDGAGKQIPIYQFEDNAVLRRQGAARFDVAADVEASQVTEPTILQGRLEQSNVNMMAEMARMMDALRSFEALQKTLKTYDTIAQKASEIGTIG